MFNYVIVYCFTDDAAVNKSLVNSTNGLNNNFTATITRNVEGNAECNDYSSFEDLLNIDNFITQAENRDGKKIYNVIF